MTARDATAGKAPLPHQPLDIAMESILESLGQAILYFDRQGVCGPVCSRACMTLLETDPRGRPLAEVLKLDAMQRERFLPLLNLLFDGDATAMPFEELILLAPQRFRHSKDLRIALTYRPILDAEGNRSGILLIATDVTLKLEAREKLKAKEEQVQRTLRIAGNRGGYVRYLHSFELALNTIENSNSLSDVKRDLHTLKSMARVFYLSTVAELLHEIEDRIEDFEPDNWQEPMAEVMADYRVRLDLMLEYARWLGREIWGYEFDSGKQIVSIDTRKLYAFSREMAGMLGTGASPAKVIESYFHTIASVPVADLLNFFEMQVGYFAEVADRQVRFRRADGDDVRIFPDFYGPVLDSLTHIARNIIDHAYEPPAMREILGKLPELHVTMTVAYTDASKKRFTIIIADDGQGISPDDVREKLSQHNPPLDTSGENDEQVIQHIFDADFSTKADVDMNSGRGIGMNVVKASVERLGGTVRVDSKHGFSTTFTIELPVLWEKPA